MIQKTIKVLIFLNLLFLFFIFFFCWSKYKASPLAVLRYLFAQIGSSVGVSLTVPENPFNTWAKQLQEKEAQLQEKEKLINELLVSSQRESKFILVAILVLMIILFFLLLLNFYFDWKSRRISQT